MTIEEMQAICNQYEKPRRSVRHNEHNLQVSCVNWFRYAYPKAIIYAIPNGAKRDKVSGALYKAEGMLAGIPDLCVPIQKGGYGALYLEMKDDSRGRLSDNQKEIIPKLQSLGNKVEVIRTFEEFCDCVNKYMKQ